MASHTRSWKILKHPSSMEFMETKKQYLPFKKPSPKLKLPSSKQISGLTFIAVRFSLVTSNQLHVQTSPPFWNSPPPNIIMIDADGAANPPYFAAAVARNREKA